MYEEKTPTPIEHNKQSEAPLPATFKCYYRNEMKWSIDQYNHVLALHSKEEEKQLLWEVGLLWENLQFFKSID